MDEKDLNQLDEVLEPIEEAVEEPVEEPVEEKIPEPVINRNKKQEDPAEEVTEEPAAEEMPKKKSSAAGIVTIILVAVILLVSAFFIYRHLSAAETAASDTIGAPHHINAHGYDSWSVHYRTLDSGNLQYYYLNKDGKEIILTADDVNKLLDTAVITCGDKVMTNRDLQYYYTDNMMQFYNTYYSYLSYVLDTSAPMDSQINSTTGDGTGTWQKTFLNDVLTNYCTAAVMVQEAEKNGFTLTEDQQAEIATYQDLDSFAMYYGVSDSMELVKTMYSPAATVETYQNYIADSLTASFYLQALSETIELTDEEVEAYYDSNSDVYAAEGIQKIDENVMNIRHILIQPEATEDGSISEEAWAAAEAEAARILEEWKAGEATEDTFSEAAQAYSTDTGSASYGGLYEDVYPGQMVTEFNDWCFDDARQTGDTGIVKTTYGYHIMYYVSQGDYIYWRQQCESALLSEKVYDIRDEIMLGYTSSVDSAKIIVLDASQATVPTVADESTNSVIIPTE